MAQLISGKPYSLNEIFCGENDKVIIPDLQRDYCWGNPFSDESEDSLVSSFLDSIISLDKSKDITMGLIYGYYDKKLTPYHLQLCDGQQRLTTLFLILGILNRMIEGNSFKELLISNFELNEDDNEPHLLYGIRESSLYFLSDLTIHFFLDRGVSLDNLNCQPWFLNSYYQDPTICSIRSALKTIESKITDYEDKQQLGDFLTRRLKFLFYDMANRQNGEETFVVINTTGEPLSPNQNLKPQIILSNSGYERIVKTEDGSIMCFNTAHDWEEMETWFWKKRRMNDIDTSTEGMLAFLHCVRILEGKVEEEWYQNFETQDDKFPLSINMANIWSWFCAYKRIYETDFSRLHTETLIYPETQKHYTQKDLYTILPTMMYCAKFPNATDIEIQRIYHMFSNMAKHTNVYRSSQNGTINVPAYRNCQIVEKLASEDILSLLDVELFKDEEELTKLSFIKQTTINNEIERLKVEELFAEAESFNIYEGQIQTLVNWSNLSITRLYYLFNKIKELWINGNSRNKLRQALLAFGIENYPMATDTANHTLCSKTEWRTLFEKQGNRIIEFINEGDLNNIIQKYRNSDSPYCPLIDNISYLDFAQDHKIRLYAQNVIEVMAKTKASAKFLLFHNGEVFEKDMVDMNNWCGFWVWSDGRVSVFYTQSNKYNLTLDMNILEDGYKIIAWLDRRPAKPSLDTSILKHIGFCLEDEVWTYPIIKSSQDAKEKFIFITKYIDENS